MSLYSIDIEADGPCPGHNSMIAIGMVRVIVKRDIDNRTNNLADLMLDRLLIPVIQPLPNASFEEEALAISGLTRAQCLQDGVSPDYATQQMVDFVFRTNKRGRPMFLSDSPFDWQWVNYYLHTYRGENPFGWSGLILGSFFKGLQQDLFASFKNLRDTHHDHNPLNDALGNAEAFVKMIIRGSVRGRFDSA